MPKIAQLVNKGAEAMILATTYIIGDPNAAFPGRPPLKENLELVRTFESLEPTHTLLGNSKLSSRDKNESQVGLNVT